MSDMMNHCRCSLSWTPEQKIGRGQVGTDFFTNISLTTMLDAIDDVHNLYFDSHYQPELEKLDQEAHDST
jgi:hypothetical protein